jgi:hypothetical protein
VTRVANREDGRSDVSRRRVTGFVHPRSGEWTELVDPDGPATPRQLRRLNADGKLELVGPGEAEPLTKAQAAGGIDDASGKTDVPA